MAAGYRRRNAERMLLFMVAAQGDEKSWDRQRDTLLKLLNSDA
ncbi:MAG TPA: hypothetical protein VGY56_20625 [Verrucomicrobiae bacterium]|nr:hypothetical protein [Verrucomicrobiae bacterium]